MGCETQKSPLEPPPYHQLVTEDSTAVTRALVVTQWCEGSERPSTDTYGPCDTADISQDLPHTPRQMPPAQESGTGLPWTVSGLCGTWHLPPPAAALCPTAVLGVCDRSRTYPGSAPDPHSTPSAGPKVLSPGPGPPRGPAPYLCGDHLHLHIAWEGQVRLEALGQGHKEVQGGQQVLVEDGWEG